MFIFLRAFVVLFFIGLTVFQVKSLCAIDYFDTKITEDEKAIFAYLRAGQIIPDYEKLIKGRDAYRSVSRGDRDAFFLQEQLRLGRGYSDFDPDIDFLEISAPVLSQITVDDDGQNRMMFTFFRSDTSYTPTFDYPYVDGEVIALIVSRLAVFSNLIIPDPQYKIIKDKVTANNDEWFNAVIDLKVRVVKADTKEPNYKDGVLRWLMVGDIAYIKSRLPHRYEDEIVLWDWVAPWYEQQHKHDTLSEDEKYPHPFDLHK